jgi:ABC-type hemin transport system ATPase subunit
VAAEVRCVVSPAVELARDAHPREVHVSAVDGGVARLSTQRLRAELRGLGNARYAATAMIAPTEAGCSALLTALAGAIIEREGGFVMHATAIELERSAVLFVGPSGAGKTTAARHCDGASWFARDRAAVFPTSSGWHVAGLAGGDTIDLPHSTAAVLPLASILRVRRGEARIERTRAVTALGDLRESVMASSSTPELEADRLRALVSLQATVPVGHVSIELGRPLRPALSSWLEEVS